jgi:hypothetical protein
VTGDDEVILAYWSEHREQLRQSETQRATLTNYVLIIASALGGFIVQQRFANSTIPLSVLIVVIGLYGAGASAKYHERADYHLSQARALTRALKDLGLLVASDALIKQYRDAHYASYPRLHRLRLYRLWTGLNLGVAGYGLVFLAISLVR